MNSLEFLVCFTFLGWKDMSNALAFDLNFILSAFEIFLKV